MYTRWPVTKPMVKCTSSRIHTLCLELSGELFDLSFQFGHTILLRLWRRHFAFFPQSNTSLTRASATNAAELASDFDGVTMVTGSRPLRKRHAGTVLSI